MIFTQKKNIEENENLSFEYLRLLTVVLCFNFEKKANGLLFE